MAEKRKRVVVYLSVAEVQMLEQLCHMGGTRNSVQNVVQDALHAAFRLYGIRWPVEDHDLD